MRAVECVVPKCTHLHAERDAALVATVLAHVHEAHPDVAFSEQEATSLVEVAGYADLKHSKKKDWLETAEAPGAIGDIGIGGSGGLG